VNVQKGKFEDEQSKTARPGYVFTLSMPGPGQRGRVVAEIKIAALPLRNHTAVKEKESKKMVLYILRDWLEVSFNFQTCTPDSAALLIPFMLTPGGDTLSSTFLDGNKKYLPQFDQADEEIIEAE
jgi:hypothetical protein